MMKKAIHNKQNIFEQNKNPLLIVISGPSGVGKDAILNAMKQARASYEFITTVTTRAMRANEKNDVDYHFVTTEAFQEMLKQKDLLEYASVYGNWYGIPKAPVKISLQKGKDTIIKVDIQGAATVKKIVPDAVFVFILPPSPEELTKRLKQRSTETDIDFALRVQTAAEEMKRCSEFDYLVVNNNERINEAIAQIEAIVTAEKCRSKPRNIVI